jgi:hypothetical protein
MSLRHQLLEILLDNSDGIQEQALIRITHALSTINAQDDPTTASHIQRDLDRANQRIHHMTDRNLALVDELEDSEREVGVLARQITDLRNRAESSRRLERQATYQLQTFVREFTRENCRLRQQLKSRKCGVDSNNANRVKYLIQKYGLPEELPRCLQENNGQGSDEDLTSSEEAMDTLFNQLPFETGFTWEDEEKTDLMETPEPEPEPEKEEEPYPSDIALMGLVNQLVPAYC